MPSLFRFLVAIGIVVGVLYVGMFVLTTFFEPKPREISVSVPPDRFLKQR